MTILGLCWGILVVFFGFWVLTVNRKKADAGEKGLVDSNKLDGRLQNTHKKSFQANKKCLQDGFAEARATSMPIWLTIDRK